MLGLIPRSWGRIASGKLPKRQQNSGFEFGPAQQRKLLDRAQSFETKFGTVIARSDSVEMLPEVVAHMMKKGYTEAELLEMKSEGFRYSPSRDTLISAPVSSDDEDLN